MKFAGPALTTASAYIYGLLFAFSDSLGYNEERYQQFMKLTGL